MAIEKFDKLLAGGGVSNPFVLITGSEDATLPIQTDKRERRFTPEESSAIARIATHPLLRAWFVENLDDNVFPKLRPLPTGVLPGTEFQNAVPVPPPLVKRPLKALCAHRVREGEQWQVRRDVTRMAKEFWQSCCDVLDDEVGEREFTSLLERYAFVCCVQGGGIDPSPKAWQALLHGAIPIILRSSVSPAYSGFPVVVVDAWSHDSLTPAKLLEWRQRLAHLQDDLGERAELVRRLSADHWWAVVTAALEG